MKKSLLALGALGFIAAQFTAIAEPNATITGKGSDTLVILTQKAIEVTEETVLKKTYPIWRYLYVYVNPAIDRGEVSACLNWIRSDDGQELVKEIGFFPLPPHLREK